MRVRFILATTALALTPLVAQAQWKSSVLPVVGTSPEAGWQFGLSVFGTRQPDDTLGTRASAIIANAVTSTEGQQQAFLGFDSWTTGNQQRLQLIALAISDPLPGSTEPSWSRQNQFVPTKQSSLTLGLTKSWKVTAASWRYFGFGYVVAEGTNRVYVGICDSIACPRPLDPFDWGPTGARSYRAAQGSLGWVKDTRDNLFAATRGRVVDASFSFGYRWAPNYFEQRKRLQTIRLDWREYRSLADAGSLAARFVLSDAVGFTPIGSLNQHSVYDEQTFDLDFTGAALTSRIEWRGPATLLKDRLGFATFANVLTRFDNGPRSFFGAGLRYRLDSRTRSTIRVDYAVGASGQTGLYVAFNEAF